MQNLYLDHTCELLCFCTEIKTGINFKRKKKDLYANNANTYVSNNVHMLLRLKHNFIASLPLNSSGHTEKLQHRSWKKQSSQLYLQYKTKKK